MNLTDQFAVIQKQQDCRCKAKQMEQQVQDETLGQFKRQTLQALEIWRTAGAAGQLLCDETSVALVFDRIKITYDEENRLRFLVYDGDEEIDMREYAQIIRIDFAINDYPRVHVVFHPPHRTRVTQKHVFPEGSPQAVDVNEKIRQWKERGLNDQPRS